MVGVDRIAMYVPDTAMTMQVFAEAVGVDPEKCLSGLGQEVMAVPAPDEDSVTMGASAAKACLADEDLSSIGAVIFSTESGVDQSKAASIYIHSLLELPRSCLCWEVKQACSGSTMALINALDFVSRRPDKKVLVIASDVALYDCGSPGELTQGAGAVAMLISQRPALLAISPEAGFFTEDVMDFWRPNYSTAAKVDGRFSIKMYQKAVAHCWADYQIQAGHPADALARICFHQPFTRMADKALKALSKASGHSFDDSAISMSQLYNRVVGNTYSASMPMALCSLLEQEPDDLSGHRIGLFGYGSGAVAAFYSGTVTPGYKHNLQTNRHTRLLNDRTYIHYKTYLDYRKARLPTDGSTCDLPEVTKSAYRLRGIRDHQRLYTCN